MDESKTPLNISSNHKSVINTSDISYQVCEVTNPATVSGSVAVKEPFSLDQTSNGNQIKESVSYKQYNSNFLLKIQSMCK